MFTNNVKNGVRRRPDPGLAVCIAISSLGGELLRRRSHITEKVERLRPGLANGGLCLVQGQSHPCHYRPRPCQGLSRMSAAEDDKVIGVGDDVGG